MAHIRGSRPPHEGPASKTAITTTAQLKPTPIQGHSQLARVFVMLVTNDAVCATSFLEAMIPRYGARLLELKRLGWAVGRRRCSRPGHQHRHRQLEWYLEPEPEQLELEAMP